MSGTVDGDRPGKAARIAHVIPPLLALAIAARLFSWIAHDIFWWSTLLSFALTMGACVGYFSMLWHQELGGLCIRCMSEVPENGSELAEKKMWWLWLHHLRGWRYFALFGACVAWSFVNYIDPYSLVLRVIADTPVSVFFFGLIWSLYVHHHLKLWCPWCRDDEGWGMVEEVPDPVNSNTKD